MKFMISDAICRRLVLDTTDGPAVPVVLGGMYSVQAKAPTEIELIAQEDCARSVIYAGSGEIFLFIPQGSYLFHNRALVEADTEIAVELRALALLGMLRFVFGKALALSRRGPAAILSALRHTLRMGTGKSGVVGARMAASSQKPVPSDLTRPVLEPMTVPPEMRAVSIVIPTKEHVALLRACMSSLSLIRDITLEVIVIDNGATNEEMLAYLADLGRRTDVRVLRHDIPFNFSRLCNIGAALARYPVLCFLNDDIEACDGFWLEKMLGYLARLDTGVVGARLIYPSGDLQHVGIATNLVPGPGHPWLKCRPQDWHDNPLIMTSGVVDAVTAACMVVRRETFTGVGGFNETDFPITVNDVDLCLRIREAGLNTVYAADAILFHKEGQTRSADDRPDQLVRRREELKAFFRRHPLSARHSVFYPATLRRDSDGGLLW